MFVVVAWLRRTTSYALSARLSTVASNLPSFTFGASMRSRYPLRISVSVRRCLRGILRGLGRRARGCKTLDCKHIISKRGGKSLDGCRHTCMEHGIRGISDGKHKERREIPVTLNPPLFFCPSHSLEVGWRWIGMRVNSRRGE